MIPENHILLAHAHSYDRGTVDLTPPGCRYDVRAGTWMTEAGVPLVRSEQSRRPPQSKKADLETGEDQKRY